MFGEAGLPFAGLPERIPSSRRAQRVAIAGGGELLPALASAYWARGRDIGDDEVIVQEAVAAGMAEDDARGVLAGDAHLDTLLSETRTVLEHGATGVPAWVIDGGVLVPGAQPHETFERVLARLSYA
jgi:predicted DsbA family dithiol-disulfide isomerase